jgi:hypothetical protein
MAYANVQKLLAVIRAGTVFREQYKLYARGPTVVAVCAFLYGREYGRWECGAVESIPMIDPDDTAALVKGRPDLKQQLKELRECAEAGVQSVAEAVQESIGIGVGVEALSQWAGFARFCRKQLGVEPLALLSAFGLNTADPAAEVMPAHPDAKVDEAIADHWAGKWVRDWDRRFAAAR